MNQVAGNTTVTNKTAGDLPAWLPALGLVITTLIVYLPATQCGFIWDDDGYVENNTTVGAVDGLRRIWFEFGATQDYYPLTFTSYWLEWWLWEFHPFGYHLNNVLLHALNVVLLWRLLARLQVPGALFAALLFAVHPVHVESVAWVTERKNVLSGLFCLLSLHAFVSFASLDGQTEFTAPRRWWFYALSVGAFLLAMLAKTAVIALPLLLPVLVWWKRGRLGLQELLLLVPYFLVVAPLFAVAFLGEANFGGAGVNILVAEGDEWNLSLLQRLLLCGRVLWFYFAKLVWPHPLIFIYPRWQIDVHAGWQYLYPLAAVAVPLILWRLRHRIGRGPLAAALAFGLMLGPASGFFNFFFQRYSYVADHLQYLASIAVTTLLAAMATQTIKYFPAHRLWGTSLAALLLSTLAVLSWRQQAAYRNPESLWRDTLAKNDTAWIAHNNLGVVLERQQRSEAAVMHYQAALRIKPDYAEAHNNLGAVLHEQQRFEEAVAHYQEALRIKPDYAKAHYNWGMALEGQQRFDEAVAHYQDAVRIKPDYAEAHYKLGNLLCAMRRLDEALVHYQVALQIKPDNAEAHYNCGVALQGLRRFEEALVHYQDALRIKPAYAEAHNNLGTTLQGLGRSDESIAHFQEATRINPVYAGAHTNLGLALANVGHIEEAVAHYREALRIMPDNARIHNNCGLLLSRQGRLQDAIRHFQKALRLMPDLADAQKNLRRAEALLQEKNNPAQP